MRARLLVIVSLVAIVFCLLPTIVLAFPVHVWSRAFGDSPNNQTGRSVAVDAAGNVVVVGNFVGTIDLGGGPFGPTTGQKDNDIFVAKFDPAGNHLWSKRFGDTADQSPVGVALDSSGNVLIAVFQTGTVDYGGGPLTALAIDVVIVKLDASGNHLWSKQFGDFSFQSPNSIAVDSSDNVLVTGLFYSTIDFGCGPMTSAGGADLFLTKLDPSGNCVWSKRAGDSLDQIGYSVATDPAGNVFVAGEFSGSIDFGGGPLTYAGQTDMMLAKFDPNGVYLWSKSFGSANGHETATSIACDTAGHVSLAGVGNCTPPGKFDPPCVATVDFGGGPLVGAGGYDVFVADFDGSGAHQWSKVFGDANNQSEVSVAIDSDGDRLLFGAYAGTIDFGTGPLTAGGFSLFLASFKPSGAADWANEYGASGSNEHGFSVAANNGNLAITGQHGGNVNFGGGNISSSSIGDAVVAKFSEEETVPVLISRFTATARDGGIDLRWNMSHDEELSGFSLLRRDGEAMQPTEIASGDIRAANGTYFDAKVVPATTYHYELVIRTRAGDEFRSPVATATTPVVAAALGQNRPNPFNPATTIEYSVSERTHVVVGIYDATGALVTRLDEGMREPGTFGAKWDGRDAAGRPAGSGVYFYRLEGSRDTAAKKMVLLK